MTVHELYGLCLSSPVELPGLPVARTGGAWDVDVRLNEVPAWAAREDGIRVYESPREGDAPPALVATRFGATGAAPAALRLAYEEGITFWITADGAACWAAWRAPLVLADAMTFLTGPALGAVLRLRGVLALHASAVVIGDAAIAFVGPGGAGKSTLATALAARGHAVLTDDVLALHRADGRWLAQPGAPQLRIWEDSERLVLGDGSRLAPLTPTWAKRGLDLATAGMPFHRHAAPLERLLLVAERTADTRAPRVERATGREAIVALVANTYTGYLLDDAGRAAELRALGDLVRAVPPAWLRVSDATDVAALGEVVERWTR